MNSDNKIIVVGTGPAGLMAGTSLLEKGYQVDFYDAKNAPGRKFLVAGNGGFNLTHSEQLESFIEKYNHPFIKEAVKEFTNDDFVLFLKKIGIETFVGSSGKIFPIKGIKPIEVIQKWISYIEKLGGKFYFNHQFVDFTGEEVEFTNHQNSITKQFSKLIFALGGASWKKTGSTGEWKSIFENKGIICNSFQASNSGFEIENWDSLQTFEGNVAKNCAVKIGNFIKKGEVVFTNYGLEGNPIYHLNKYFREDNINNLFIDFKPSFDESKISSIIQKSKNITSGLLELKFSKFFIQFIKQTTTKEEFNSPNLLAKKIKNYPFKIKKLRDIDEVISTIGGIDMKEISESFQLTKFENVFVCGEMLDWDAPTGGYLIQGCASTGKKVGDSI